MKLEIPELSLVLLIGPSGSGKSTFARQHFLPTEVVSSDTCRGFIADDENDQSATKDAFELVQFIAKKRLEAGRLTVIDATNVQRESRKPLVELARKCHCLPVAIVFDLPERLCQDRNKGRDDRNFGPHVVDQQIQQLRRSFKGLKREGFRGIHKLKTLDDVESVEIERTKLWPNLKHETGPFDLIGDVHGCFDELSELLKKLGYEVGSDRNAPTASHPEGRKAVFLGDLVDRGPDSPAVLRLVMSMVGSGSAYCVPGNHDIKLQRKLRGRDVKVTHGLQETLDQLEKEPDAFKTEVAEFIDGLVSHRVFDDGKLVAAHAGLKERLQGRASKAVREFALWGETTGETDDYGLPVRYDWASEYRGPAMVVYGHTPVPEATWVNKTICIDTGCVFGGSLTALRYPEKDLVSVPAAQIYYEPVKPLKPVTPTRDHHLLDIDDVRGKRVIETRVRHRVTVREENAAAALEVMSRFAVDPRWLIYLPPTMSPPETAKSGPYLEHPAEALGYYRSQHVGLVICEEKHMGSRAIVVVCRSEESAAKRFGVPGSRGIIYTRTGRRFFSDHSLESELLSRIDAGLQKAGVWEELSSDWVCLDTELLPWSQKAQDLLQAQYAAVGRAGRSSLAKAESFVQAAIDRDAGNTDLLERIRSRRKQIDKYVEAYREYCWPVKSIDDLKVAPFHILASEGAVHTGRDHRWHMETSHRLADVDSHVFRPTPFKIVDLTNDDEVVEAVAWWEKRTEGGGEGMVIKPLEWLAQGKRGLVQPAIKCRGREYLRIIYGPEYTTPELLDRLRARGLKAKRSLAMREFALGLESLHRFVEGEPLYRVHECVFGVLAMESEPVDPRL
ncbi:MAG: polynucleotide kinase-phosphatase [Myxococcales bacterium]|nr:polynucleotide kinase-phosphatase [Myxococcales bacterium]